MDTCLPCCFKLFSDPNSKISLSNDAFSLGAGPPKIVTVTVKLAKNRFLKHFLSLFKGLCLLYFFKDQKLRETEKKLFFLRAIQNNFVHFGGLKFFNLIFSIFLLAIVLWSQSNEFSNFQIIFNVPATFRKWKLCRARSTNLLIFRRNKINILDRQQCVQTRKLQKKGESLHPTAYR